MKLANIIGLLGLISIIVLIIIYIIKPNFQQKFISSTYVWKLSLKYRKKRISSNKLRNLLIIICQILILTSCALILAKPIIEAQGPEDYTEKIIVIDASANMRASDGIETRFERAVDMVQNLTDEVLKDGGVVSIILAGREATVLIQRADSERADEIQAALTDLVIDDTKCTYGEADIAGAMTLAETILQINPESEVRLYTATEYIDRGNVTIVDCKTDGEWNAAILNASATVNERLFYTFTIDVAVYGRDADVELYFEIFGVDATSQNPGGKTVVFSYEVRGCNNGETMTVTLDTGDYRPEYADGDYSSSDSDSSDDRSVMSFDYVYIYIKSVNNVDLTNLADSIEEDNRYFIFGGKKQTLNVQYASWRPNPFTNAIISDWRSTLSSKWSLSVTEVPVGGEFAESGYDVYIFEHVMPKNIPDDGLVIFLDPPAPNDDNKEDGYVYTKAPAGLGLTFGNRVYSGKSKVFKFSSGVASPITASVMPEEIEVTDYTPVVNTSGDYQELLYCENGSLSDPILLVKNTDNEKIMVFAASVHAANFAMLYRFPVMMLQAFNYFFPATISDYIYKIGDTATFNSVSASMSLTGPIAAIQAEYTDLPGELFLEVPGRYILTQQMFPGSSRPTTITTYFYVKMPQSESNTERVEDYLINPYVVRDTDLVDLDLLIYFAAALVALLVIEWWLQSRDQF